MLEMFVKSLPLGCDRLTPLQASHFDITLARTYKWDTEDPRDQAMFLYTSARLFRQTNPGVPLATVGFNPDAPPGSSSTFFPIHFGVTHIVGRLPSSGVDATTCVPGRCDETVKCSPNDG